MSDPEQDDDMQDDTGRSADELPDGSGPAGHSTQEDGDDDQFQG